MKQLSYKDYDYKMRIPATRGITAEVVQMNFPVKGTKYFARIMANVKDTYNWNCQNYRITQRAMAASPLFMGGALTTSPTTVFELITDYEMLKCNQNGITGKLVTRVQNYSSKVDIWKTPDKTDANKGWIGVFNRNPYKDIIKFDKKDLGLNAEFNYSLYDIWGKKTIDDTPSFTFELPADDVIFIRYEKR